MKCKDSCRPFGALRGVKQQQVIPEGSLAEYVEVGEIIGTLLLYRYCYVDLYLYIYIHTQILCYQILRYVYIYTDIVLLDIAIHIYIYTQILWYDIMTQPRKTYLRQFDAKRKYFCVVILKGVAVFRHLYIGRTLKEYFVCARKVKSLCHK